MKIMFTLILVLLFPMASLGACTESIIRIEILDPVDNKPFVFTSKVYRPLNTLSRIPAVFILPPIVGETVIDRRLAKYFCQNNVAAYVVSLIKEMTPEEEIRNLNVHDNSYVRALAAMNRLLEVLKDDKQLNGNYGILGMSLGGMLATYISGNDSRIKASVVVVAAGNVSGVLSYSDQELVVAQREARMKMFGIKDQESYEKLLNPLIPNDPINFAQNIAPDSMYMFIANNDTTVPTRYQQLLRGKIPKPLVYEMNANHFSGIVKAGTVHAKKILNFFKSRLIN